MTHAICVRCGAMKFGCLLPCKTCGQSPRSGRQMAYSYLFSDHYYELPQLQEWSEGVIRDHVALPRLPAANEEEWIATCGHGLPVFVENEEDVLSATDPSAGQV